MTSLKRKHEFSVPVIETKLSEQHVFLGLMLMEVVPKQI